MFKLFRQTVPKLDIKVNKKNKIVSSKETKEITKFKPEYENIMNQLVNLCDKYNRRSINSSQVGLKGRIAVLSMPTDDNNRQSTAYFNPVILDQQGLQHSYEYSSERTDVMAKKYRPYQILVEAQDYQGNKFRKLLQGTEAILLCHEIDSLNGVDFLEDAYDPSFAMTPDEKKEYRNNHPQTIISEDGNYDELLKNATTLRTR